MRGEIYIPDLVGIELLRHFERRTYELVKRHSEFLTTGNLVGEEERKATAQSIVDSAAEGRRHDVNELLRAMFPILNTYTSGWGSASQTSPMLGRRISSPEGFDAFFRYTPVEDEIRIAELSQVVNHLEDEAYLRALFAEKLQQTRSDGSSHAASLLEELNDVIGEREVIGPAVLNVLLEYGDELLKREDYRSEFFFPVANDRRLARLFARITPKLPSDERFDILAQAVQREQSAVTASAMLVGEAALPYKLIYETDRETETMLTEAQARSLGALVADKVQHRAEAGTLQEAPELWILLKSWKVFGEAAEARASFVESHASPPTQNAAAGSEQ